MTTKTKVWDNRDRRPWAEKLGDRSITKHEDSAYSWHSCAVGARLGFPARDVAEAWLQKPKNQEIYHLGLRFPTYVRLGHRERALEILGQINRALTKKKIADFEKFRDQEGENTPFF